MTDVREQTAVTPPWLLDRARRAVRDGPRPCYRAALVSLAGTCVLAIAICLRVRPTGYLPGPQREIIGASLAGLALTLALGLGSALGLGPALSRGSALGLGPALSRGSALSRAAGRGGRLDTVISRAARRTRWFDSVISPQVRAAIWLALAGWFPLLSIWVYYRAQATMPLTVEWIAFGYLDKRWLISIYLLGALAPMVLLVLAARLLQAGRRQPPTWRSWFRALAPAGRAAETAPPPALSTGSAWRTRWPAAAWVAAGIVTAIALAWYFYGPPWYLDRNTTAIGAQDDVFLAGLQAMSKGHLAYVGPASVQYGPGAQLLSYLLMRHVFAFSVVGFRQAWALFQWSGASLFFVALFLALGYARGLAAALLSALLYPALQQMGFNTISYAGFFGWSNPLRYAGAITLVILLPAVVRRCPAKRGLAGAAALGLVFGATSYIAQENLIGGLAGAAVLAILLLLSGTSSARAVLTSLAAAAAGFAIIWAPVLAFYASRGLLGRFLYLYTLLPRAVAVGYSNTSLFRPSPWVSLFYYLPFVLAVLALLSVVSFRPLRVAFNWSGQRIMVVTVLVTTILMFQGAMLRSDAAHLTGTLLILPATIVVAAAGLPQILGAQRRGTMALAGAALFAASFLLLPARLLPSQSDWPAGIGRALTAPYRDRQAALTAPPVTAPASPAAQRVGPGLDTLYACCQGLHDYSMRQFTSLMDQIHRIVGNRVAYVANVPRGYPGLVYFVADLNPAPIPADPWTMVMTLSQQNAWLADFERSVLPKTRALLTESMIAPEAIDFARRYPHARRYRLRFAHHRYFVFVR